MGDPMNDHIARIHIEIQQRLAAILVADEDRGQLGVRAKTQTSMHTIIRLRDRLESTEAAIPVVEIAWSRCGRITELPFDFGGQVHRRRWFVVRVSQHIGHIRLARVRMLGARAVVEVIFAPIRQYGQVGADLGGLGLEKQVIALRGER